MAPKKLKGLLPIFLLILKKLFNRRSIRIQESIPGFKKKTGIFDGYIESKSRLPGPGAR